MQHFLKILDKLKFPISDSLISRSGQIDVLTYRGVVNDKWYILR